MTLGTNGTHHQSVPETAAQTKEDLLVDSNKLDIRAQAQFEVTTRAAQRRSCQFQYAVASMAPRQPRFSSAFFQPAL